MGSGKYPDAGTNYDFAIVKKLQTYGETVSCFAHLAER